MSEFKDLNKNVLNKMDFVDLNVNDLNQVIRTVQNLTARSNTLVSMYFREYDKLDKRDTKKYKTMKVK